MDNIIKRIEQGEPLNMFIPKPKASEIIGTAINNLIANKYTVPPVLVEEYNKANYEEYRFDKNTI